MASACASEFVTPSLTSVDSVSPSEAPETVSAPEAVEPPPSNQPGPPSSDSIEILWREAELSGETFFGHLMAADSEFRAYRFAHGAMAWTSSDGISWTPRDLDMGGSSDEIAVFSVVQGGRGFMARGSDSWDLDTGDHSDVLWTSTDGFTWTSQMLELEQPTLGVFAEASPGNLVIGSGKLLMVGRMDRGPGGPDEHGFFLWTSDDGSTWNLIEDAFPAGTFVADIQPGPRGFVAHGFIEGSGQPFELWSSEDGRSWESIDVGFLVSTPPPTLSPWPAEPSLAIWNDRLLAGVTNDEGIRIWTSEDVHSWDPLPTHSALDHTPDIVTTMQGLWAGPAGIVIVGAIEERIQEPERRSIEITSEGRRLFLDPDGALVIIDDESGATLLEMVPAEGSDPVEVFDEDTVSFVDPATGETLMSIGMERWFIALEEAGWLAELEEPGFSVPMLWFSPDGTRWAVFGIEETFGVEQLPEDVVVGENGLLLRWSGWSLQGDPGEFDEPESDEEEDFGLDEDPPDVLWAGTIVGGGD